MANYSYVEAIGIGFPGVECHAQGAGEVYEELVWDAGLPLPSKEALDTWILSNPKSELPANTKITVLAFRNRFTLNEKVQIDMASIDSPAAPIQQRQLAAQLRVMNSDLTVATFVDLARPDTRAGVQQLETFAIIGAGRASEILDDEIQASEVPIEFQ